MESEMSTRKAVIGDLAVIYDIDIILAISPRPLTRLPVSMDGW